MRLHPVACLKAGLRAHWLAEPDLAAAFENRILETLPPGIELPLLLMGEATCRPEPGAVQIDLALRLVTAEPGTAGLLALLDRLEARLAAGPVAVPPCRLVSASLASTTIAHDAEAGRSEANLRLVACLDLPEED